MDREHAEAEKGESIPIRRWRLIDREEKIKKKNGQTKPYQKQDFELLMNPTPTANSRPSNGGKDERRVNGKVLAKKAQQFTGAKGESFLETAPRTQMRECDPGVLRIPKDGRDRADNEYCDENIQSGAFEFWSQTRSKRDDEQDRDQFQRIGVFAEKTETDEQSGQRPVKRKARTFLGGKPKGEHGRHPKEDRQRIDGHDERTDVEDGCHI